MLTDRSVDGIKTGHTQSAGYCLAVLGQARWHPVNQRGAGRAKGMSERFQATQALLNYGFSFFESRKLYDPSAPDRDRPDLEGRGE
jgi:D-alanyl-D-alanine carboxypeptidase (penicillin-binding protein 5/6)